MLNIYHVKLSYDYEGETTVLITTDRSRAIKVAQQLLVDDYGDDHYFDIWANNEFTDSHEFNNFQQLNDIAESLMS
jgi:hypothetical protein